MCVVSPSPINKLQSRCGRPLAAPQMATDRTEAREAEPSKLTLRQGVYTSICSCGLDLYHPRRSAQNIPRSVQHLKHASLRLCHRPGLVKGVQEETRTGTWVFAAHAEPSLCCAEILPSLREGQVDDISKDLPWHHAGQWKICRRPSSFFFVVPGVCPRNEAGHLKAGSS